MRKLDLDTLLFFDGHQDALELYRSFEELIYGTFPWVNKRVQKTQITFTKSIIMQLVSKKEKGFTIGR